MGRCKSWALNSGLDHGLDYGLEYGLIFTHFQAFMSFYNGVLYTPMEKRAYLLYNHRSSSVLQVTLTNFDVLVHTRACKSLHGHNLYIPI